MYYRHLLFLNALFSLTALGASEWELIAAINFIGPALAKEGVCIYQKSDPVTNKIRFSCSFFSPTKSQVYENIQNISGPELYASNGFAGEMIPKALQATRKLCTATMAEIESALTQEEEKIAFYKSLLDVGARFGRFSDAVCKQIKQIEWQEKMNLPSRCPNPFLAVLLTELLELRRKSDNPLLPEPQTRFLNALTESQNISQELLKKN